MVKNIKTIVSYQASDGREFSNEDSCKDYEETAAIGGIIAQDRIHGRLLTGERLKIASAILCNYETISAVIRARNSRLARKNKVKVIGAIGNSLGQLG